MNLRNRFIANHSSFLALLQQGVEARGLIPVYDEWHPSSELLEQSLACFVWFYDCLRFPVRIWLLKQRLQKFGVPLVAWNQDAPYYLGRQEWRLDLLNRFRLLDVYATHTLVDRRRTFADSLLYLPNAVRPDLYNLRGATDEILARLRRPESYRWDVSFFGGMDPSRYKEDADRAVFFAALAERLDARGISHCFREATNMSVDEQVAFVKASRINLNFGARCEFQAHSPTGLPERCYGVPACGGFLLCDKRTHARDDFAIGENWAEFDGLDDAVTQIEYWLANFTAARDLAERCHAHVMARHTYTHRAATLHQALLAWHEGKRGLLP